MRKQPIDESRFLIPATAEKKKLPLVISSGGYFTKEQLINAGWKFSRKTISFQIWEGGDRELLFMEKGGYVSIIYKKHEIIHGWPIIAYQGAPKRGAFCFIRRFSAIGRPGGIGSTAALWGLKRLLTNGVIIGYLLGCS